MAQLVKAAQELAILSDDLRIEVARFNMSKSTAVVVKQPDADKVKPLIQAKDSGERKELSN